MFHFREVFHVFLGFLCQLNYGAHLNVSEARKELLLWSNMNDATGQLI